MQEPRTSLAVRYVNKLREGAYEINRQNQMGLVVVNAPRPIPGEVTWEGPFITGLFYAAGLPAIFEGGRDS